MAGEDRGIETPGKLVSPQIDRRRFVKTAGEVVIFSGLAGPLTACSRGVTSRGLGGSTGTVAGGSKAVLFHSDWSTATGKSTTALYDGGKWNAYVAGNDNSDNEVIVEADPTGSAPTKNILYCNLATNRPGLYAGAVKAINIWRAIAQGSTLYRRCYVYLSVPDAAGNLSPDSFHPVGDDDGDTDIGLIFHFGIDTDGTFYPVAHFYNYANFNDDWWDGTSGILQKDAWYRLEWAVTMVSTTTPSISVEIKIYDASNTVVMTEADFSARNGPARTLTGQTIDISSIRSKTIYRSSFCHIGNNGPDGGTWNTLYQHTPAYILWAAACASTSGWIGPYAGGV